MQIWTAATRAMESRKIDVVDIMTTSISSTWRMNIAVSEQWTFHMIIFRGIITVRLY